MNRFVDESERRAELPPALALERASELISPRSGVIRSLSPGVRMADLPRTYEFTCLTSATRLISDAPERESVGSGTSLRRPTAKLKAVGEALERYALAIHRTDRYPLARAREVRATHACVDPAVMAGRGAIPAPVAADARVRWTPGVDLGSGEECWVPSQLVFVPYAPTPGEDPLWAATSSGVAAGTSMRGAAVRGTLELVEREAFLLTYLHRHRATEFDLASLGDRRLIRLLGELEFCRLELKVLDLTTDLGLPVALAVLLDRTGRYPALTLGAKASFTKREAVVGAVEEAFHGLSYGRATLGERRKEIPRIRSDPSRIQSLDDRLLYWAAPEALDEVSFLTAPLPPRPRRAEMDGAIASSDRWAALRAALARRGVSLVGVDLTTPDVAAHAFRVVRVVSPELIPLYLREEDRSVAGERILSVPRDLGWTDAITDPAELHSAPHPFL